MLPRSTPLAPMRSPAPVVPARKLVLPDLARATGKLRGWTSVYLGAAAPWLREQPWAETMPRRSGHQQGSRRCFTRSSARGGEVLQRLRQQIVEASHRIDLHPLVRRVREFDLRPEEIMSMPGDHLADEPALQAGVDGLHVGIGAQTRWWTPLHDLSSSESRSGFQPGYPSW